jgi:signal transduction histidine kinase
MVGKKWLQPPRRVLTSFLAVVIACLGALAWFAYRILDQDRALESQRIQEQLELAADLAAANLTQKLSDLEKALDVAPGDARLPEGSILIVAGAQKLDVYGRQPLLFCPVLHATREVSSDTLHRAELIEFQQNDPVGAAALFREESRSRDPELRAAALVRLGRSLRKAGQIQEALAAYSELAALDSTPVSGLPAGLVAREARCSLFEASARHDDLRREAAVFLGDLESGRWRLTRSAYEFRAAEARRWLGNGTAPTQPADALAISDAVENLTEQWLRNPEDSTGRVVHMAHSDSVLLAWRATPDRFLAVAAGPRYLSSLWSGALPDKRIRFAITDTQGRTIFGLLPEPSARSALRAAAVTGLPWTIHVASVDLTEVVAGFAARRRLLLGSLLVLAVLLMTSSYFIVRAMTRELAVARLQSDFVASVSHEFRSPLTSMRQLSSMLVQGRLASEEQRQRSYELLAGESERLERLVEGLLDFGLIEAGETRYRLESVEAGDLVRDIVAAFQRTVSAKGYRVELALPADLLRIQADRDALGRALWNLLDNAVKYSLDNRTVRVEMEVQGDRLAIGVRDQGMGIPATEQKSIFQKFVRGENSRQAGIKGAGLGLAMVQHIVAAHGGEIRLESVPGKGSRFTIVIPLEKGA